MTPIDVENRIKKCMTEVLCVPLNEIHEESSVRSIPSWRGQNHIRLIEAIEKEFSISFEQSEQETLINYKVIKATLLAYID